MKVKEILLGIAIAIIFLMFCVFGTKLIYDTPKYEDYCDYSKINPINTDGKPLNDSALQAQQEAYNECAKAYDVANKEYSKNMFIISLVFGIIVFIVSIVFIEIISISGGLMLGSLIFIIYGTARYWNYMDDLTRFVIVVLVLGILIYVAYWLSKREENIKKPKTRKKNARRRK
jgi:hypothetical protein